MIRAGLAGLGVALAAGPLGCFVIWRRMAYFGDATAHAAVLGVAIALAAELPIYAGVLLLAIVMGLLVSTLVARGHGMDATLGVVSHSALALGLVAMSFLPGVRVDLSAFLFGDILAVGWGDLAAIWVGALIVAVTIVLRWSALLMATLNPDLAFASGIHPRREELWLILALAVVVAVAIKVVGALLIASMLIIPAAAARPLSRSPEAMAAGAIAIGTLAVAAGLWGSWQWDLPAGPSVVSAAAAMFALTSLAGIARKPA